MLLPLFEWCEISWLGQLVRTSLWLFPVTEAVHLLGLCLMGGALGIVDLRLFGFGLTGQSIAEIERGARPWFVIGLTTMLATGLLLFMSEAVKCYHNPSFWVMINTLPFAMVYTFLVRQRVASRAGFATSWRSRALGAVSLVLWFTVAAAGRWIGFSS